MPPSSPPGQWERVQGLIAHREALPRGSMRNKHLALLSGLLYCDCCAARMVYSYASKGGRKYPYYLCRNAQQKGWAVCPSKSLPAQAIEESVVRENPGVGWNRRSHGMGPHGSRAAGREDAGHRRAGWL